MHVQIDTIITFKLSTTCMRVCVCGKIVKYLHAYHTDAREHPIHLRTNIWSTKNEFFCSKILNDQHSMIGR